MNGSVSIALVSFAGVLLTVAGTYAGVRYTTGTATKAQAQAAVTERERVDATAYNTAREIYGDVIEKLGRQVEKLERQAEKQDQRIEHLERDRINDRAMIQRLSDYARELSRLLRGAGIAHPAAPEGFSATDS